MARKLKQNQHIRGIEMQHNVQLLLSQFADDTALYLTYDKITLENVITVLEHIETNTGLTISYEKTLVYRIGSLANSDAQIYTRKPLKWTNEPFTLLGVVVDNESKLDLNYEPVIEKMQDTLNHWMYRPTFL